MEIESRPGHFTHRK